MNGFPPPNKKEIITNIMQNKLLITPSRELDFLNDPFSHCFLDGVM